MKMKWMALLFLLSSCKQYNPTTAKLAGSQSPVASLSAATCEKSIMLLIIQPSSTVNWSLASNDKKTNTSSQIQVKLPASGKIELVKGLLAEASGRIDADSTQGSTGDPIRDRLFQDVLFDNSGTPVFHFTLQKLVGRMVELPVASSISVRAEGVLEIGGRKSSILMPVDFSEKSGLYELKGVVDINVRESRPANNSISLDDKLTIIGDTLEATLGRTLQLQFSIQLKNSCIP